MRLKREVSMGRTLIIAGLLLVVAGLLYSAGWLSWFGKLPGDIRIERPNTRIYFPITSMLLASIVFSLVLAVLRRWK